MQAKWHVLEAKGRSKRTKNYATLVRKAKNQAAQIESIDGSPPATTSAVISLVTSETISVVLDDPPATDEGGEHWEVNQADFLKSYYRGLIHYIDISDERKTKRINEIEFQTVPLRFYGLSDTYRSCVPNFDIGLPTCIYDHPEDASAFIKDWTRILLNESEGIDIGKDGIAIIDSEN